MGVFAVMFATFIMAAKAAICSGPLVSASKNQGSIGGCYDQDSPKINGFSSYLNDKNILMYWEPKNGGQWVMGDAVGKAYRAYAKGPGGPGPTAIAPDAWYTYGSGGWVKERLVIAYPPARKSEKCPNDSPFLEEHSSPKHGDVCRTCAHGCLQAYRCITGCSSIRGSPFCVFEGTQSICRAHGKPTPKPATGAFLRIDNLKVNWKDPHGILNLREVTAYDKDGKALTPLSARMSSTLENDDTKFGVGNCHDGKADDGKFCHAADGDKNPWLVFGYRAEADIRKIVVVNRGSDGKGTGCCATRIIGATIRICSDSECTKDVLFSGKFEVSKKEYTWLTVATTKAPGAPTITVATIKAPATNKCTCANGVAKKGSSCTKNGAAMCHFCMRGFAINSQATACVETNVCTCANGAAKTGAACTKNGAAMCLGCKSGWTMNSQATACVENQCTCANGDPKTGAFCKKNGAAMCRNCKAGYTINYGNTHTCVANQCTCANGAAKTGAACTRNGAAMCQSCKTGFTMNSQATACVANQCTCANGAANTGFACKRNGAASCSRCNAGFTANSGYTACAANQCTCANGSAKTGSSCTRNGAAMCQSCKTGYTLNSQATACVGSTIGKPTPKAAAPKPATGKGPECKWTTAQVQWKLLTSANTGITYEACSATSSEDTNAHEVSWEASLMASLSFGIGLAGEAGGSATLTTSATTTVARTVGQAETKKCAVTCEEKPERGAFVAAYQWTLTSTNLRTKNKVVVSPCQYVCVYGKNGAEASKPPQCLSWAECNDANCHKCFKPANTKPVQSCTTMTDSTDMNSAADAVADGTPSSDDLVGIVIGAVVGGLVVLLY